MILENMIRKEVKDMPPSGIRKFFDIVNEMEDVISLGVGEPDFVTPWNIREAGIYSLEQGDTHYSSNAGFIELREEIAKYLKRRFDLSYNPSDEILVTVGGSEGIDIALRALVGPGDEVLIPEPSFVAYKGCTTFTGAKANVLELKVENDFKLTADELEEAIESSLTGTAEDPVDYDTFEELRISNRQIRYISNLARRNDYRVPYVKNGQAGLINLTFVADDNDKGKISIKMNTASWGELSVEAKVTQSDVSMYVKQDSRIVLSEDRSIYKYFQQIEGDLKEQFGYDNVRINCVRVPDVKYTTYEDSGAKIPSDRLYKIASAITGVFFGA